MLTERNLRPYQSAAIDFLIDTPRAHLWADMGMGKSAIVLTAFDSMRLMGGGARNMLVIAPLRVAAHTWPREPQLWRHLAHLRVVPVLGSEQQRRQALQTDGDIYTTNIENLIWLVNIYGRRWPFDWVVVDESTRLKKPSGKRFRAARRIHKLPSRWTNLSGTPSPNGLLDIWAPTYLLDSGRRLDTAYTHFRNRFFISDYMGYSWTPAPGASRYIHSLIQDITLSIRAEDHLPIREPIHERIYIELPKTAARRYQELERDLVTQINADDGEAVEAVNAAVLTGKLRQVTSGAIYTDDGGDWTTLHDEKINALQSIIEESAGEPLLIGYIFRHSGKRLRSAIPGARYLDEAGADAWNRGEVSALLVHPASAGHGINLQHGGRRLALFDADWDLELYQQLIERIGPTRQYQSGYARAVYIYHLAARGTIDEDIIDRREGKASAQDALLSAVRRRSEDS